MSDVLREGNREHLARIWGTGRPPRWDPDCLGFQAVPSHWVGAEEGQAAPSGPGWGPLHPRNLQLARTWVQAPIHLHRNTGKSPRGTLQIFGQRAQAPTLHETPHKHSAGIRLLLVQEKTLSLPSRSPQRQEGERQDRILFQEAKWRPSRVPEEAQPYAGQELEDTRLHPEGPTDTW